eukprot:CAMPEP_0167760600 /NCGR_PEP_ID=MMETSP0110_2-20121227/11675_1 /TAXON_ID=629695 /ORGANISM="Gymnochlora sp., Strain CCMP2014" /LENGTH=259 /DNA_ID=CAMNT_0007647127 /DNA_START=78 /DNA_END=857 /DNA_ORIENTATION=+
MTMRLYDIESSFISALISCTLLRSPALAAAWTSSLNLAIFASRAAAFATSGDGALDTSTISPLFGHIAPLLSPRYFLAQFVNLGGFGSRPLNLNRPSQTSTSGTSEGLYNFGVLLEGLAAVTPLLLVCCGGAGSFLAGGGFIDFIIGGGPGGPGTPLRSGGGPNPLLLGFGRGRCLAGGRGGAGPALMFWLPGLGSGLLGAVGSGRFGGGGSLFGGRPVLTGRRGGGSPGRLFPLTGGGPGSGRLCPDLGGGAFLGPLF